MSILVISAALSAAFCNALGAILQRQAIGQPKPKRLFQYHFLEGLFSHRRWIIGECFDVLGFLLQAVALWKGSIIVIMPIMSMDLVFLMLLLHYRYHFKAGKREWVGVLAVTFGVAGFIVTAHPEAGQYFSYTNGVWIEVLTASAVVIFFGATAVRHISSSRFRAGIAGAITGLNFAISAVLTKVAVEQFSTGFFFMLSHWIFYVMILSLVAGFVNIQSTYGSGSLAISQPALQVVGPLLSIVFGVVLFSDTIRLAPIFLGIEVITIGLFVWGIILLTNSPKLQHSHL